MERDCAGLLAFAAMALNSIKPARTRVQTHYPCQLDQGTHPLASLLAGKVNLRAAIHNSIADKAAELRSGSTFDLGREAILQYCARKQQAKDRLFAAIHFMIARVAAKAAQLGKLIDEALTIDPNFNLASLSKQALETRKNEPVEEKK